jgi:hypothetical protein
MEIFDGIFEIFYFSKSYGFLIPFLILISFGSIFGFLFFLGFKLNQDTKTNNEFIDKLNEFEQQIEKDK